MVQRLRKVLQVSVAQSCPTPLRPHGLEPSRLLCPWEFPRQEYWSGLPFSSPGDLPDPGIQPESPPLQVDSLPSKLPGKPTYQCRGHRFDPWSGKSPQATARKAAVTRSLGNQRGPRTAAKTQCSQRYMIFFFFK